MSFEDHFSRRARVYARYRPSYPPELFAHLAALSPGRRLAWDCGTGNGQAALELAEHFDHVVATDASAEQIEHAFPHESVEYRVEPAEKVSLPSASADLVTVAIAVHWFDLEPFYAEVRRVLRSKGILAVWTYHLPRIDPEVDRLVRTYYRDILKGYWPERFHYVDERYETLPFPFEEVAVPVSEMETEWNLEQLAGFLDSWSATRRYESDHGRHPLTEVWDELAAAWGEQDRRRSLAWPLHIRAGRT